MLGDFHMLVGLPASGKSTYAKQIEKEFNATILSSDEIRKEIYGDENIQSDPSKVFEIMNIRAEQLLEEGKNVIYDATNINRKRRKHLINHVLKANNKTVYYMNGHITVAKRQDSMRERTVGFDVINKMYKTMQIPIVNEGWNSVVFVNNHKNDLSIHRGRLENNILNGSKHSELFTYLSLAIDEFGHIYNLPQDSAYHSFSVSRHTHHVYKYLHSKYSHLKLLWASLFHDLGKYHCKSFVNFKGEETKYANFRGHELVGSQLAAHYLSRLGYNDDFVKDVAILVQFHMYPMNASEKKMNEIKCLIGENLYDELMLLHDADLQAK